MDEERLNQLLKSWNQSGRKVAPDGNCLFYSMAYNLKIQVQRGNSLLEQILAHVGIQLTIHWCRLLPSGNSA